MDDFDPGGLIPEDPEYGDDNPDIDEEGVIDDGDGDNPSPEQEYQDSANLSWEELAVALGFAEEMTREEQKRQEPESNRISAKEYQKQETAKKKKKRTDHINKDLRPFERYVEADLAMKAQKAMRKKDPIDQLVEKLEVCGLNYKELRMSFLKTKQAEESNFLPQDIEMLNLNICVDLINILNECIYLDTTDIAYILKKKVITMWTPQMKCIQKWLNETEP